MGRRKIRRPLIFWVTMQRIIDLRSDTVTRPSKKMREVIANAVVGDDVFEDDPTVKKLEQATANVLGKEAALFVPSGTMANQISLRTLCDPGDEVICERGAHIVNHEVAAASALSGIMLSPYDGKKGRLDPNLVRQAIRHQDIHYPRTRLIALENTHNRAGGAVLDIEYIGRIEQIARESSLSFYLDGARLWNAAAALKIGPKAVASHFDMVSVCFSKGLGAPIGSAVSGPAALVAKARRIRKMLGGGMRQVGIIAAAALFALENNLGRLAEDHVRAQNLARGLAKIEGVAIDLANVQSNIVVFSITKDIDRFLKSAASRGLLMVPFGGDKIRAVAHLDVGDEDIARAVVIVAEALTAN